MFSDHRSRWKASQLNTKTSTNLILNAGGHLGKCIKT